MHGHPLREWSLVCLLVSAIPLHACGAPEWLAPPITTPSRTASGDSTLPQLSLSGRWLVFQSTAPNLVTNDWNGSTQDIFVRDLSDAATLRLVSVSTNGTSGNSRSHSAVLSEDGTQVAFVSAASDLVPNDVNQVEDVFVRDLITGVTRLASVSAGGAGSGSSWSDSPSLSADGTRVAFRSASTNLVTGETPAGGGLFLRDFRTGETWRVAPPASAAGGESWEPRLSPDGARVVFLSRDPDLVQEHRSNSPLLVIYEATSRTHRVIDLLPVTATGESGTILLGNFSADGRRMAVQLNFQTTPVTPGLMVVNLDDGTATAWAVDLGNRTQPKAGSRPPRLSADGAAVVFEAWTGERSGLDRPQVWRAAQNAPAELVSTNLALLAAGREPVPVGTLLGANPDLGTVIYRGPDGTAADQVLPESHRLWARRGTESPVALNSPGIPEVPSVATERTGTRIAFTSRDDRLVDGDRNAGTDLFLHDLSTGSREAISLAVTGVLQRTGPGGTLAVRSVATGADTVAWTTLMPLGADDPPGTTDLVVRHPRAGTHLWVTRRWASDPLALPHSPSLSADGRWLAFELSGTLAADEDATPWLRNVFLCDVSTGDLRQLSRLPPGVATPTTPRPSRSPVISPDGRYVAFVSRATLAQGESWTSNGDLWIHDRLADTNRLATRGRDGGGASREVEDLHWSPDSRHVYFKSIAANLTTNVLSSLRRRWFRYNVALGRVEAPPEALSEPAVPTRFPGSTPAFTADGARVAWVVGSSPPRIQVRDASSLELQVTVTNASHPQFTPDGRHLLYHDSGSVSAPVDTYRLRELATGVESLPVLNSRGEAPNRPVQQIHLTPDGQRVIFTTAATNLHPALAELSQEQQKTAANQLYARDLTMGEVLLLSVKPDGTPFRRDVGVFHPLTDPPGVVFATAEESLIDGDLNEAADLFLLRVEPAPGPLLVSIRAANDGRVRLLWLAQPGTVDRLEFREAWGAETWSPLSAAVAITAGQAVAEDPVGNAHRFYRVVRRPAP